MKAFCAGMNKINNKLRRTQKELTLPEFEHFALFAGHDFFHRKGCKDSLIGIYANKPQINADERRFVNLDIQRFSEVYQENSLTESIQNSDMPVTTYEKVAASRFRTRMTRIARIFTDILDPFTSPFHSTDNKPQRSQRTQSRMGKLCALCLLCDGLTLFSAWLTRIYTYPRVSASTVAPVDVAHTYGFRHRWRSAFYFIPSAFICVHLRLIYVSLSDRTRKIQFEKFTIMRNFLLFPGFSKQNIMKSPWRGEI